MLFFQNQNEIAGWSIIVIKHRYSVNKKDIVYLILFIPYLLPGCISDNAPVAFLNHLDLLGNIARVVAAAFIILLYYKSKSKPAVKLVFWIFIYSFMLVISSIITGGRVTTSIVVCVTRTTLCMLIALIFHDEKEKIISKYLKVNILINFIAIILKPNGLYRLGPGLGEPYFFIGHKNIMTIYLVFSLLFIILEHRGASLEYWIYLAISLLTIYLGRSSTGLIVILIFCLLSIFPFKKWRLYEFILNDRLIYFFMTAFSLLFTVFSSVFLSNTHVYNLIYNYFHKDLTLHTRTYLWSYTWMRIMQSPIVGWGFRNDYNNVIASSVVVNGAHNAMLQVLFSTGIVGLILLFKVFFVASKKNISTNNSDIHIWINMCVLSLLIIGIMEPVVITGHLLFIVMVAQLFSNAKNNNSNNSIVHRIN